MNKHLLLFAAVLALPVAGVILWMVTPARAPIAARDTAPEKPVSAPDAYERSGDSLPVKVAGQPLADTSKIVRRADDDFSEMQQQAPFAATAPIPVAISPRFTVPAHSDAVGLVEGLRNKPASPNERIRSLPAEVMQADFTESSAPGGTSSTGKTAPAGGAVVLQVDHSLHDPAAWVDEKTPADAHLDLKARVADEFAVEVRRAATDPETTGKSLDETWRDARARSNWEYQKFFGGEAANRAAINAGRAAVSKP